MTTKLENWIKEKKEAYHLFNRTNLQYMGWLELKHNFLEKNYFKALRIVEHLMKGLDTIHTNTHPLEEWERIDIYQFSEEILKEAEKEIE